MLCVDALKGPARAPMQTLARSGHTILGPDWKIM